MNRKAFALAALAALACSGIASAADMPNGNDEAPTPAIEQVGIWGAIAYSPVDGKHGIFWGADKRDEAETTAIDHCEHAEGESCILVMTFRNHRHWGDDDESGFPYNYCAALAVNQEVYTAIPWAAASAVTRRDAEAQAIQQCQGDNARCKILESGCT